MSYLAGIVLIACGASLLLGKYKRIAATILGAVISFVVFGIYLPIMIAIPADVPNGLNYFADTLLFAGTILVLANAFRISSGSLTSESSSR